VRWHAAWWCRLGGHAVDSSSRARQCCRGRAGAGRAALARRIAGACLQPRSGLDGDLRDGARGRQRRLRG
jgi:hypothetical protein